MSRTILSFDIGIKNLAWCVTNLSGEQFRIQGWGNFNLLEGKETEEKTKTATCKLCSAKIKYTSSQGNMCGKHIPSTHPLLKDASGVVFTKLPSVSVLKVLLAAKGVKPIPKGKDSLVQTLQTFYSIPAPKVKVPHASAIDVSVMHDAIRKFINSQLTSYLDNLTEVRLENQPVLKNPVMKTIQILLFATLRDTILEKRQPTVPIFKLVHAGTKIKGKETGDKGYKARKEGSENKVLQELTNVKTKIQETIKWKTFFEGHKKRSDLADAFCMCLDAYPESAYRNA